MAKFKIKSDYKPAGDPDTISSANLATGRDMPYFDV